MNPSTPTSAFAVSALTFAIDGNASEIQLLPAGIFRAQDGRPEKAPHWKIDVEIAAKIMEKATRRTNPMVIDYEHQTLHAAESGQPAPAAGWFSGSGLEWREGQGLFATGVSWTPRAAQYIKDGEYRFVSAVFPYNATTGEVLDIYMAAITNNPALDGMQELEVLAAACFSPLTKKEDKIMDPILAALLKALNLPEDTNEADALAALTDLQARAEKQVEAETALAALKADLDKPSTPDPAKYVPVSVVTELREELAALTGQINGDKVNGLVTAALASGKLHKAQEQWARDLGNTNLAALTSYLDTAQPIAALTGMQTRGKGQESANEGDLTPDELAICTSTGIDPEEFKKTKGVAQA